MLELQLVLGLFITFLPGFSLLYLAYCIGTETKPFTWYKKN